MRPFRDRRHAGKVLAAELAERHLPGDLVVLALPRGGVPVAFEVARALGAPLDIFVVRKLGFPGHEELAMGAIASGGVRVLNEEVLAYGVDERSIEEATARETLELQRRERLYRRGHPEIPFHGKTAIIVDDGLATGSTMRAAVRALRLHRPARIVVAVPVASRDACHDLGREADDIICLLTPEPFHAVGLWFDDFRQTTDDDVFQLLDEARPTAHAASWT